MEAACGRAVSYLAKNLFRAKSLREMIDSLKAFTRNFIEEHTLGFKMFESWKCWMRCDSNPAPGHQAGVSRLGLVHLVARGGAAGARGAEQGNIPTENIMKHIYYRLKHTLSENN